MANEIKVLLHLSYRHHILKLEDLTDFETAKFMFKIDKNMRPKNFHNFFVKVLQIYTRNTRSSHHNKLYLPKYRFNHLQRSI